MSSSCNQTKTSASLTVRASDNGPKIEAVVRVVTPVGEGLRICGAITLLSGTLSLDEDSSAALVAELGVSCQLSISDDGTDLNSTYLQRVVRSSIVCTGQVRTVHDGRAQRPYVMKKESTGTGVVNGSLISLRWRDCIPSDAVELLTGFTCTFEVIIGRISPIERIDFPSDITAVIVEQKIGARCVPPVSNFVLFDSSESKMSLYTGANVRISAGDLADLNAKLGEDILSVESLYVDAATSQDGDVFPEIYIGNRIFVCGLVVIDCGHSTPYVLDETAENNAFSNTKTLPSLRIAGTVGDDILFTGPPKMSAVAVELILNGGKLIGRPKTLRSPVHFLRFIADDGAFIAPGDKLTVAISTTDANGIAIKRDGGDIVATTAEPLVLIQKSAVYADLATSATTLVIQQSRTADITHQVVISKPASFSIVGSQCGRVRTCTFDTTKTTQHSVEESTFDSYVIGSLEDGITHVCVNTEIRGDLRIYDWVGEEAGNAVPDVTVADVVLMSSAGGLTRVGRVHIDDNTTITITSRVDIGTVTDGRSVATAGIFKMIEAEVTVGSMSIFGTKGFPLAEVDLVASSLKIGSLELLGDTTPFVLNLICGPKIRSVLDRSNACAGLTIKDGSICLFTSSKGTSADFALISTRSQVQFRFAAGGITGGTFKLSNVVDSVVRVEGRIVQNSGGKFDNKSYLYIPFGSTIVYSAALTSLSSSTERFKDLVYAYPSPAGATATTLTMPDNTTAADAVLQQFVRHASALNSTTSFSSVTVGGEVFSLRPEILRNLSGVAANSGYSRLSFETLMFA